MRILLIVGTFVLFISCGKNQDHSKKSFKRPFTAPQLETKLPDICQNPKSYRFAQGSKHQFAFTNFGYRGIGRCRGHSLINQKFNRLAVFLPSKACKSLSCYQENLREIDKIMRFEVGEIKGFSSIYTLSLDSRYANYIRSYIRGVSHRYSSQEVQAPFPTETQDMRVFSDLKRRIKKGHLPYIGLGGDNGLGNHGVLGIGIKWRRNQEVICVRDPNIILKTEQDVCLHYVYLDEYKRAMYAREESVSFLFNFSLTNDENDREKSYDQAKLVYCKNLIL